MMWDILNSDSIVTPLGSPETIHIGGELVWKKRHTYGVSWDKSNTQALSRTDEASGFSDPTIGSGTTAGSSPFDDCYPWDEIKKVTDGSNTLVAIPRFYYKWTNASGALTLQITNRPADGFYTSPMHADRGDGKGEREVAYIGRYKCASSTYYSASGASLQKSMTRAAARSKIAALGTGYYQFDFAAFWTLRMLYLVEFANWDGIAKLTPTSTYSAMSSVVTGATDSMTYHTGVSADGYSVQYRYVEDPWTNGLEWCDGVYLDTSNVYCIKNPAKFSDSANGTKVGTRLTSDGYVTDWAVPTASGFEYALWPSAVTSTVGYVNDYYYPESGTVLYTGSSVKIYNQHGPFFMYCDYTADSTSSVIATRLMKLA